MQDSETPSGASGDAGAGGQDGIDHLDDFGEVDDMDEFDLARLGAEPSPRRLPSWIVNPVHRACVPHACRLMSAFLAEPELKLGYDDQFREYVIGFADPDPSVVLISHCPFCGELLPPSLREEWFDRVHALDLEPDDEAVPQAMRSGDWWRDAGL